MCFSLLIVKVKKKKSPSTFRSCSRAILINSIRGESSCRHRSLTPLQIISMSTDYIHGLVAVQSKIPTWITRTLMKISFRISGIRIRSNRVTNPVRNGWNNNTLRFYHLHNHYNQRPINYLSSEYPLWDIKLYFFLWVLTFLSKIFFRGFLI